jgi:hypothetical protein
VADTEPGKMILAQKMAVAARAVTRCPVRLEMDPIEPFHRFVAV